MINSSQNETKKEKQNYLIDSEDEYDMNSEIYAEPDIKKIDSDVTAPEAGYSGYLVSRKNILDNIKN